MTAEIVPYTAPDIEYVPRFVLDPAQARALDQQLRAAVKAVLVENHDYGKIPGADKPSLWQPGAEKLLQLFGLGFTMERGETERGDDGQRLGITYRCTVFKEFPDRRFTISVSEGYAGYDEEKYYQSAAAQKAKAEKKERDWAARDGRPPNPAKWEYRVYADYRAPWNTIIKMAQKRALVSAVKDATAAGALFADDDATQDASPAGPAETATPAPHEGKRSAPRTTRPKGQRPAGEAPGPEQETRDAIRDEFTRLGVPDSSDRAVLTAQILQLDDVPGTLASLTLPQQKKVLDLLVSAPDLDKLNELISDGVVPDGEARDGEG